MTADDVIIELEKIFLDRDLCCHEQQPLSFQYRVNWAKWRLLQREQETADQAESKRLAEILAQAETAENKE